MDLALNNLQRLICHKTQPTNQSIFYEPFNYVTIELFNHLLTIIIISYLKPFSCEQIIHIT